MELGQAYKLSIHRWCNGSYISAAKLCCDEKKMLQNPHFRQIMTMLSTFEFSSTEIMLLTRTGKLKCQIITEKKLVARRNHMVWDSNPVEVNLGNILVETLQTWIGL